jgi:hypothetical protein
MWSKVKAKLREYQTTNANTLSQATAEAFHSITVSNTKGKFKSSGYF